MHPVTAAPVTSANEAHAALRPAFPETLTLRYASIVLVLPLGGCYASPIWWIAVALFIYGVLLGLYPED